MLQSGLSGDSPVPPEAFLRNAVNSVNELLKIKIEIYFQLVIAENVNSPNKTVQSFAKISRIVIALP